MQFCDETHDAMMNVHTNRFDEQVETITTELLVVSWRAETPGRKVS